MSIYANEIIIYINDTKIERESQIKMLVIIIDDKLKFDKHINILCKHAAI